MATTPSPTLYIEPTPSISLGFSYRYRISSLLSLSDGSFISCSTEVRRWLLVDEENDSDDFDEADFGDRKALQLIGIFDGWAAIAVEKDCNTLITGSSNGTLKEWDMTTYQCINTLVVSSPLECMMKTKNNATLVCGSRYGEIEIRRLSDLRIVTSFRAHSNMTSCLCELEDGSIVSGAVGGELRRWDTSGRLLQAFLGGHTIHQVIEWKHNVILSGSGDCSIKLWNATSGDCLRTMTVPSSLGIYGLIPLSRDKFVSGSSDGVIRVWDERGRCIETIRSRTPITLMIRVGEAIVTGSQDTLEVWRLRR